MGVTDTGSGKRLEKTGELCQLYTKFNLEGEDEMGWACSAHGR